MSALHTFNESETQTGQNITNCSQTPETCSREASAPLIGQSNLETIGASNSQWQKEAEKGETQQS